MGLLTFHCVMRDNLPMEAVQLRIHISSVCWGIYKHVNRRGANLILDLNDRGLKKDCTSLRVDAH